jgi:hypothetical protein
MSPTVAARIAIVTFSLVSSMDFARAQATDSGSAPAQHRHDSIA